MTNSEFRGRGLLMATNVTVKSLTNDYECIELIEVNIWQLYSYIQAKVQALVKMTKSSTWYIYYIVVLSSGLMLLHPLFYNPHTCTDILLGKPFFKYLSHTLMINEHDCCLGFFYFLWHLSKDKTQILKYNSIIQAANAWEILCLRKK